MSSYVFDYLQVGLQGSKKGCFFSAIKCIAGQSSCSTLLFYMGPTYHYIYQQHHFVNDGWMLDWFRVSLGNIGPAVGERWF